MVSALGLVAGAFGWYGGLAFARQLRASDGGVAAGLVVAGDASRRVDKSDRRTPVRAEFRLHNPGPRPVRIQALNSDCNCASLAKPDREVRPGQSVPIVVSVGLFDEYATDYRATVRVETDAAPLELTVFGTLPPATAVRHFPARVTLAADKPGRWADNRRELVVVVPKTVTGVGHVPVAAATTSTPRPVGLRCGCRRASC